MPDYSELMTRARADTQCATQVWANILSKYFENRLEYIYTKGSSQKNWDSHIDYVPIISDVDIHVDFNDDDLIFGKTQDDFDTAVRLSKECEEEFLQRNPDHLHVPRMQIIETRFLMQIDSYTPPRSQDILVLFGEPQLPKPPSPETIRSGDLEKVFEEEEYLDDLPRLAFDRTGLDFWALIRRMCWRVSPCPVRILTQTHPDPMEVWSWNRTTVHRVLLDEGYDKIAKHYFGFYESGWKLYLSKFRSLKDFRQIVIHGYYVLRECLEEARHIRAL